MTAANRKRFVGEGLGISRLEEVLSQLHGESVDCVVTSPGPGDFDAVVGVFAQLRRVLVDSGVVWVNVADDQGCLGRAWRTAFALQRDGWILRNTVIWHQPSGGRRATVLLLVKQRSYWFDLDAIRVPERTLRLAGGRGKNPGDVWPMDAMDNSAAFPVEVARRCVAAGCPPAGTVLDPFSAGNGVRVAARSLGRRFLGRDDLMRREVQDAA